MKIQDEGLKKEIGVFGLSANIVNMIIGSGIFVLPAIIWGILGPASILAYIVCGILVACIMLCYAETGSKISQSGGDYTYVEIAFGKYAGFMVFMFGFIANICGIAAITNALLNTLAEVIPLFQNEIVKIIFILLLFASLTIINVRGVKQGIGIVKLTTLAKILPLAVLILAGLFFIEPKNITWTSFPEFNNISDASLILFFAFIGGQVGLTVGGEIISPQRTVPRSIFISMAFVVLFYILIQLVVNGILGNSLDPKSATPLAYAAQKIFGSFGFSLLLLGAAISMFGAIIGIALNAPRPLFAVSRDNVLPINSFKKIHSKYFTPYVSIIVFTILACLFTLSGGFEKLAILSVASTLLIYCMVSISVFKFRKMADMKNKGFTIPGGPIVPVFSIIISLVFLSQLKKKEIIAVLIFIGISSIIYLIIYFYKKRQQ